MRKILLFCAFFAAGCSGVKNAGSSGGTTQNANISGPYSAVATSSRNGATTNVYANLSMQSSSSFSASQNTLVCPGNLAVNCTGDNPPLVAYTMTGTVNGNNVQITLQFNNASGPDTVTLTGAVSGTTLSGSYTDSQGDAGTWLATLAGSVSGSYSGSINSTPNPQPISPSISALITEGQNFALTGSASVTNSLCFVSLDFSQGTAIGGAFTLTDTTKDVFILGVPTGSNNFNVYYQVGSSATACAGDFGTGTFTLQ
ncbi:MAG TPA: hypothetical protein VGR58_05355 [Candidatus Acidoferrum sp.]|nr:hypothetical protein [Candidatus Acidoferrum sp.]